MSQARLLGLIEAKRARVGIMGMGYVGLPLVREFTRAGFRVVGFDVDPRKVSRLNAGRSYIKHIPSALVRELVACGRFVASTQMSRLRQMEVIIICVPTPLTRMREPDMSYVAG
ncbi:MAG: NAD(P)-binding domain-containing protein, partial [Phycisphaerae bacterium]